jgi:hypothetical protein
MSVTVALEKNNQDEISSAWNKISSQMCCLLAHKLKSPIFFRKKLFLSLE